MLGLVHPLLAQSLGHFFDWDVTLERVQGDDFEPFALPPGPDGKPAPKLRGRYGPQPATSINSSQMWSSEAVAVDSLLLNQAVPQINASWRVRISKATPGGLQSKYFRVDDAAVTELGFTLVTLKSDGTKDSKAQPTATLPTGVPGGSTSPKPSPYAPPPRKF